MSELGENDHQLAQNIQLSLAVATTNLMSSLHICINVIVNLKPDRLVLRTRRSDDIFFTF